MDLASPHQRLDTLRYVETPEGVELSLPVAGPFARGLAWLIDWLVITAGMVICSMTVGVLGGIGVGFILLIGFFAVWLYPTVCEVRYGATLGKTAMGLRVVCDDGTPVTWGASLIRNLLWIVDFFPAMYALGVVVSLFHRDFKRIGDMAAGTVVIHVTRTRRRDRTSTVRSQTLLEPLTQDEQRAILEFAEREENWSDQRGRELVRLIPAISKPEEGNEVERVLGIARWLGEER